MKKSNSAEPVVILLLERNFARRNFESISKRASRAPLTLSSTRKGIDALRLREKTDLYHFRCDGPRWRDRRWFMTKGGRWRPGADAGSGRVTLPAAFAGVFLLLGRAAAAAVLRTLQMTMPKFANEIHRSILILKQ